MKRKACVTAILALVLASAGCFRTVYRGEGLPPHTAMNRAQSGETFVTHFEETVWNHYFLFALVPTAQPDLQKIIAAHVPAGHQVRNLRIRHEATFVNGLIWALVGGLYNPMTTTISGDVVKVNSTQ